MAQNTHSLDLEDSSSQYASITDAAQTGLDLSGNATIEAWVKFETTPPSAGDGMSIVTKYSGASDHGYIFRLANVSGTLRLLWLISANGSSDTNGQVDWPASAGVWYHIAAVYTAAGGTVDFYVDTVQQGAQQSGLSTSIFNNTADFLVGQQESTFFLDGKIDEVRVWSTTKTSADLLANWKKHLTGSETNLQGYWRFNNDYLDQTANNNDLTASGSPVFSTDVPFTIPEGGSPMFFSSGGVTIG